MQRPSVRLQLVPPDAAPPSSDELTAAFRDYSSYVAAIALRLLGRDAEVEDVVQDVFVAAMGKLPPAHEPRAVRGWLATVTVRMAGRRLRRRRLLRFLGLDDAPEYALVAP